MKDDALLSDVLLGARIAFEGYRLPTLDPDVLYGIKCALSEYPGVGFCKRFRKGFQESMREEMGKVAKKTTDELHKETATWGAGLRCYFVCFSDGLKVRFFDMESAIQYANRPTINGKRWIEDNSPSTQERVLFVATHDGAWLLHRAPGDTTQIDIDVGCYASCGSIGRTVSVGKDEWFGCHRYCTTCFPESRDIAKYVLNGIFT